MNQLRTMSNGFAKFTKLWERTALPAGGTGFVGGLVCGSAMYGTNHAGFVEGFIVLPTMLGMAGFAWPLTIYAGGATVIRSWKDWKELE